jgi:hypothetical protein
MVLRATFAASIALAACGVGEDNTDPLDPLERDVILCRAAFKTNGSFEPGVPERPLDPETNLPITGCWPVGIWTFTAAVDPDRTNQEETPCTGDQIPSVLPEYKFRVDRTENEEAGGLVESYEYLGDEAMLFRLKVSEGGGGECEGGLELFNVENTQYWNMKPALTQTVITGFGEYALYKVAQKRL